MLVDMLATSKHDMEKVFRGSLKMLALVYPGNSLIETGKVTGMYTDMMAFVLGNMQAEFPDYKFDFGCCVLDDSIDFEDIKATQWFMFPDV